MLARTRAGGNGHLKLTLLNPATEISHVESALRRVKELGRELERSLEEGA